VWAALLISILFLGLASFENSLSLLRLPFDAYLMEISNPISAQGESQVVPLNPIRRWQTTFQAVEGQYHQRRSHKKSRNGCTACKKRRVKASVLVLMKPGHSPMKAGID
jgi:hypothetical protein